MFVCFLLLHAKTIERFNVLRCCFCFWNRNPLDRVYIYENNVIVQFKHFNRKICKLIY